MNKTTALAIIAALVVVIIGGYAYDHLKTSPASISSDLGIATSSDTTATSSESTLATSSATTSQHTAQPSPRVARNGDAVLVHYTGKLQNGTVFDSSVGKQPFPFVLGVGMVIKGWDEGVLGMKVGEKKHLVIPASKAYGADGVKGSDGAYVIPPNATLTFDIEVLAIQEYKPQ